MSADLERALRDALHDEMGRVSGSPDAVDVSRRMRRRRRRHRLMAAAPALMLVLAAVAVVLSRRGDDETAPVATSPSSEACVPSLDIPFRPGVLPAGWLMPSEATWRLLADAHVTGWLVPDGMVEVWNGARDDIPAPTSTDRIISVLGRDVPIGTISDGYSVAFDLGPTRCDRWAIVAHPGVTEQELATIASGLQLVP